MSMKKFAIRKFKNIQAFAPVFVVAFLVVSGAVIYNFNARAAEAGFYFTSPAGAYTVGQTLPVNVYANMGEACANVVQAEFTYPASLLTFTSFSASGSKFESTASSSATGGKVSIVQYTTRKACGSESTATSGVSGEQLVGTAYFTVIASGNAALNFSDGSIAISSTDNRTNVAQGSQGKSFALTTASVPVTPQPVTPAPKSAPKAPQPKVTSVTPTGSDDSVALVDNDVVEVTTPIEVGPLPVQPDGIDRIEYFLNGKLVATVKTSPYTYKLDTTKYLNGTYTMTTKTYYKNGQTKSVSQKLVVKNPFGWSQIRLWMQKYAWLLILFVLIIGVTVAIVIIRRKSKGPDNYYGNGSMDNGGDYVVSGGDNVAPTTNNEIVPEVPVAAPPTVVAPNGSSTRR